MFQLRDNYSRFLIRISAFLTKEVFEIMRQPMLVLTLVVGPFLILFFFGIGYRNEARALRTVFVVEQDSGVARSIEEYAPSLGPQLIFVGVTDDLEEARERLRQGEVDLVTVAPTNIYDKIRNNQQAVFLLYHHEIDPFQADYIRVFGRVYVNEVNRRVLRFITSEGQVDVSQAEQKLEAAQASAAALHEFLERCANLLGEAGQPRTCDRETVHKYLQELDRNIDQLDQAVGDSVMLLEAIRQVVGGDDPEAVPSLTYIIDQTNLLGELEENAGDYIVKLQTLTQLEADLETLEARLEEFLSIDPAVLISPFRSETESIAAVESRASDYFAPAVIVLLLQQLTVTFAALSMVREQRLGMMELFYVSPLSAFETLLGKYLSYLLFGGGLSAILLILVVYGMEVPMLGHWWDVAGSIIALIFTSLGIGFVISLLSKTDTQAVQYSMIILLTSVFFSGFILSLETLWEPVRIISWALPATYGILLLRDIMLRGDSLTFVLLIQLTIIGVGFFLAAWILLRRSMAQR